MGFAGLKRQERRSITLWLPTAARHRYGRAFMKSIRTGPSSVAATASLNIVSRKSKASGAMDIAGTRTLRRSFSIENIQRGRTDLPGRKHYPGTERLEFNPGLLMIIM